MMRAMGRPLRRRLAAVDRVMTEREIRRVLARNPVVVFSMGKSGTTSLTDAVVAASGRPVVKAHALSDRGIAERVEKARRLRITDRPRFLWACAAMAPVLRAGGEWDLLCGVRDPIALAVSDHFYGLSLQRAVGRTPWVADDDLDGHTDAVVANLERNFLARDWFRDELEPLTGIDVYATPFPHTTGWAQYVGGRFRALVVRAENLSAAGPTAVAEFLGLDTPVVVERHNPGAAGGTDPVAARWREERALPADLVDRVYTTPMARHFYDTAELEARRTQWVGACV